MRPSDVMCTLLGMLTRAAIPAEPIQGTATSIMVCTAVWEQQLLQPSVLMQQPSPVAPPAAECLLHSACNKMDDVSCLRIAELRLTACPWAPAAPEHQMSPWPSCSVRTMTTPQLDPSYAVLAAASLGQANSQKKLLSGPAFPECCGACIAGAP